MNPREEPAPDHPLRLARRTASRVVGGRALVLDPAEDRLERLNEVGTFVWTIFLERQPSLNELVDAVVAEFKVERGEAEADLTAFLGELLQRGLIEPGE